MEVSWSTFKTFVVGRELSIQWVDLGERYWMKAINNGFELECELSKNASDTTDLDDFENNFKAIGNKPVVPYSSPFAAKRLPNGKKLYKREHGIQASLSQGSNNILFTIPYPWVKLTGLEIFGGEHLDYTDLLVLDAHENPYFGTPDATLNQFGFSVNISIDEYEEKSDYDADLYYGMQIKLVYTSQSAKTIGVNFVLDEVKD